MLDPLPLLRDLVAVDSVNPDLVPGAPGEGAVADTVAAWAQAAGLEVHVQEVEPGRPNVVAVARGQGGGRSLMLNAHLDVVGVEGYDAPFAVVETGDRWSARGVHDTKAGLATALTIAAEAVREPLRGDVVVTAVVDEECGSKGTVALIGAWRADAAVVLEPTELRIVTDHRGWAWGRLVVHGRAAHGSRPDLGVDAIVHLAPVLAGLADLQRDLAGRPPHPELGHASVHASLVAGGAEMSTYPARCVLDVERRFLPGEDVTTLRAELHALAARVEAPATAEVSTSMARAPLHTPRDTAVVTALTDAGPRLPIGDAPFWTDAALLSEAGIPAVVFGPGGGGIHETYEWLDLASFAEFTRVLRAATRAFCA